MLGFGFVLSNHAMAWLTSFGSYVCSKSWIVLESVMMHKLEHQVEEYMDMEDHSDKSKQKIE